MTESTTRTHAGHAAYLRWIVVLGLVHAHQHGLRPASSPSLVCRAPDVRRAANPVI